MPQGTARCILLRERKMRGFLRTNSSADERGFQDLYTIQSSYPLRPQREKPQSTQIKSRRPQENQATDEYRTSLILFLILIRVHPRESAAMKFNLKSSATAANRSRERLIESGFGGSVILVRKLALLVLHLQLEEFFFERIEKGGRAAACRRRVRNSRSTHRPDSTGDEYNPQ